MRDITCCFTGHRIVPEKEKGALKIALDDIVSQLVNIGVEYFLVGGAVGFDTMAAQAVLDIRKSCPDVKLFLALPCREQTKKWKEADVAVYESIKRQADRVDYVSEEYFAGCMQKRNRYMVDHSGYCVAYLTKQSGGTFHTVEYAKKKGLKLYLYPGKGEGR